ncbi:hypothetical protein NE235_06640 [Actinoallomurus spadix]|nr:hypothetical protein [Actinoallomurus spadix]MCO5985783.1 hypothetical protein [Actinoallomurus spadix]
MAGLDRAAEPLNRPVTYLHIGAPKSGTTYLQSLLWNNRDALREDGVLYPGPHYLSHTHAALDLQRTRFAGYADPAVPGAWDRLVDEVRAWNGTTIISQELFSPARPDAIERAMASLAFSDVHLVYTARDLVRQAPAAWQEDIKNRHTITFEEFMAALRAPAEEMHPLGVGFWRMQDAAEVLERWGAGLRPGHIHLITIPRERERARRSPLWERFCQVTGLAPERYDTTRATPNPSLGADEANLLRRLNLALGEDLRWPLYNRCVTGLLAVDTLPHRPERRPIVLTGPDRDWMRDQCVRIVGALREREYDVVGDLDDLVPPVSPGEPAAAETGGPEGPSPVRPDEPSETAMLDSAVVSMVALLGRLQKWRDEADHLQRVNAELSAEGETLRAERSALLAEREALRAEIAAQREILAKPATKLFVRRLSEKNRAVMRARIIYWNVVEGLRRVRRRAS